MARIHQQGEVYAIGSLTYWPKSANCTEPTASTVSIGTAGRLEVEWVDVAAYPLSRGGLTRRSGMGSGYPMVTAANELSGLSCRDSAAVGLATCR